MCSPGRAAWDLERARPFSTGPLGLEEGGSPALSDRAWQRGEQQARSREWAGLPCRPRA